MSGNHVTYEPIGVIRSEHVAAERTPIQPAYAKGCKGWVELVPELEDGLSGLEGFSHVYLIYHMHRAGPQKLVVRPFLEDVDRGVFATRPVSTEPHRPERRRVVTSGRPRALCGRPGCARWHSPPRSQALHGEVRLH